MAASGVGRRTLVALLVGALVAVGLLVPWREVVLDAGGDPGATVGVERVDAMAPSRAVGRLVAEPSLVCVHGAELMFGVAPGDSAQAVLARLEFDRPAVPVARCVGHRATSGVRAPPARRDS